MSLIIEIPAHLSHSQSSNLTGEYCSAQYFFERGLGKPSIPGWAAIGGSALHSASEGWDRLIVESGECLTSESELQGMFNTALDIEVRKTEDNSPYPKSEWQRSGRQSAAVGPNGGPDKKNEDWWRQVGPLMLASWVNWRLTSGWEIAFIPTDEVRELKDGTTYRASAVPGIEVSFDVTTPDGIPIRGYIDRVFERNGEYLVVDLKSGREPDSTAQLGTYRYGLAQQYGIDPQWGCYWLGGTGLSTSLTDLRAKWPDVRVEKRYTTARRRQMAGEFDPKPSNLCGSCGVRAWCQEYGGEKAHEVPQPWDVTEVRIKGAVSADSYTGSSTVNNTEKGDSE